MVRNKGTGTEQEAVLDHLSPILRGKLVGAG